jgi:hypothetical protein
MRAPRLVLKPFQARRLSLLYTTCLETIPRWQLGASRPRFVSMPSAPSCTAEQLGSGELLEDLLRRLGLVVRLEQRG